MPHTHIEPTAAEQAEATERWLDSLDPTQLDVRDASHLRAIIAAAGALATAEENLRKAVAGARTAGDSWTVIGTALGTSKQAAHERFRAFVDH
jgi:Tfp pilus assembly protein PilF